MESGGEGSKNGSKNGVESHLPQLPRHLTPISAEPRAYCTPIISHNGENTGGSGGGGGFARRLEQQQQKKKQKERQGVTPSTRTSPTEKEIVRRPAAGSAAVIFPRSGVPATAGPPAQVDEQEHPAAPSRGRCEKRIGGSSNSPASALPL